MTDNEQYEALAKVARWLRAGAPFDAEEWGQYDDQMQHAATVVEDALLATDVEQVTTPTETDELDEALMKVSRGELDFAGLVEVVANHVSRLAPVAPPTEEHDMAVVEGEIEVCSVCVNSEGNNIAWDQAHPIV